MFAAADKEEKNLLSARVEVGFARVECGEQVAQLFGEATHCMSLVASHR